VREKQDAGRRQTEMKKIIVYLFACVIAAAVLFSACTKKVPSEPGPPAGTKTPTPYYSATISATITETGTDTATPTVTETGTATATLTNTPILDIYEPDDTVADAKPITVDAAPQLHNLYNPNDIDFVTFDGIAGTNYLVRAIDTNGATRPLALHALHGTAENITATAGGQPWVYMPINCLANATYYIQVEDATSTYGLNSDYNLDVITLPAIVPVDFNTAVDNASLVFTFDGDGTWVGQSNYSYTGGNAAQSPALGDVQQAGFSAGVTGPCTVKFWWKVSSEAGCDILSFYIDSGTNGYAEISGEVGWVQQTFVISDSSTHTLRWQYSKDISYASGFDTGWVDGIEVY
jgi:hypothetical protein